MRAMQGQGNGDDVEDVNGWETIYRYDRRPVPSRKEDRACCAATRDEMGRLCIGWCGPECEGRPLTSRRVSGSV